MERELDLTEALDYIDPAALDYNGWLAVGMGLKEAGYPVSAWENWSRRDGGRYHPDECAKKWEGFRGSGKPITAGTVVSMARSGGWQPGGTGGRELGWDDMIGLYEGEAMGAADRSRPEDQEVAEPEDWHPARQLIRYLETLFEASETVGYVTRSYEKDGRHLPDRGCWDRTAGKLIQELSRCGDDVGKVLGDYNPEAGAWIRFNPLDGKGFDYPIHRLDRTGVLGDIDPEADAQPWQRKKSASKPEKPIDELASAFSCCDENGSGKVGIAALMAYTGKSRNTIKDWVDRHPDYERKNGCVQQVSKRQNAD